MGIFASGDVSIYFKKEEDASKVHEILSNKEVAEQIIKIIGEDGRGHYSLFDFADNGSKEVYFKVCSDRVQNAEWQVENLIKVLKKLTKDKVIGEIEEFQAELLTQHDSWYMEATEFEEGGEDE